MKKFMVLYVAPAGAPAPDMSQLPAEVAQQMFQQFMAWSTKVGDKLVDPGAPMKPVNAESIASATGYSILAANDLAELEGLLADHPFKNRGGSFSIHEIEEIPSA